MKFKIQIFQTEIYSILLKKHEEKTAKQKKRNERNRSGKKELKSTIGGLEGPARHNPLRSLSDP